MPASRTNWAGNYTYHAARIHRPQSVDEVREVARACRKLKTLGTRHSFNGIADSFEDQISIDRLDRVLELDRKGHGVTVEAGIKYGQLGEYLHRQGFALPNLASLPHIGIAGACATATHGSGEGNGSLATAVNSMEFVNADGELIRVHRDGNDDFQGMVVGLGGFGIITRLSLDIIPTFAVRQDVYENLPLDQLAKHLDAIQASAYSVSLFTDWRQDHINQVWLKRVVNEGQPMDRPATFHGATPAPVDRHPITAISSENCTAQMGIPGPWHDRLPHFRMDYTPSSGQELQSEYFIPRQHAVEAILAIARMKQRIAPLLLISEVRTVAADMPWMSPCHNQACMTIHFTWKQDWPAVRELLPRIEEQLLPFNARPHWAKLFTMPAMRLQSLYPKLPDFRKLLAALDPHGKFRNAFLDAYIFGEK